MAVSQRFQRAYQRLSGAFGAHHDAPRDPERVVELATARAALEDRRIDMKAARDSEGLAPFRRENPEWVDPDIGKGATGRTGKVLAALAVGVLFGGFALIASEFRDGDGDEVRFTTSTVEWDESDGRSCVVTVVGEVVNDSDVRVRLRSVNWEAVDGSTNAELGTWPGVLASGALMPGETTALQVSAATPECPQALGGELRITYVEPAGPIQVLKVEL